MVNVEISLGADDLPGMENTHCSMSVFAVLWVWRKARKRWQEHGRTEVVRAGGTQLQFVRSFFLQHVDHGEPLWREENDVTVRIELYQPKSSNLAHLSKHKLYGRVETTLRALYRTPIKRVKLALLGEDAAAEQAQPQGSIVLRIADVSPEAHAGGDGHLELRCVARGLERERRDFASTPVRPFLQALRYCPRSGDYEVFFRSSTAMRPSPTISFPLLKASLHRCCFGDVNAYLRFELWLDLGADRPHELVGTVNTTVAAICGGTAFLPTIGYEGREGPAFRSKRLQHAMVESAFDDMHGALSRATSEQELARLIETIDQLG